MSIYFEVSGTSIWNPASRVGVLFAEQLEAAARFAGMESGVSTASGDAYVVDAARLAALARELVRAYESSGHVVLRTQLRAVLGPLVVLTGRTNSNAVATTDLALRAEIASLEPGMPI